MQRPDLRLIGTWTLAAGLAASGCVTVNNQSASEAESEGEALSENGDPAVEEGGPGLDSVDTGGSFLPENLARAAEASAQRHPPEDAPKFRLATWERNPSRAISKAKVLDRPMVLLFTGLEWNENAYLLSREVFLTRTFNDFARAHLTLCFVDYPENILKAPDSARALKTKYGVHGYPTLLLLDANGREIHRQTGYRPGRARDYFNQLRRAALEFRGVDVTAESGPAVQDEQPQPEPEA